MGYYRENNNSGMLIRKFFDDKFDVAETENFFKELHDEEVEKLFYMYFKLELCEMEDFFGRFLFREEFGDEYQTLKLNPFNNWDNADFKKATQLITYFHEATHKKQRDIFISNKTRNLQETSQYNNVMNMEIFCTLEASTQNNEQQVVELDAIHNSIRKFYKHLQEGNIPLKQETLCCLLYACVRYFASLNGAKHHTYCPEKVSTGCENLIKGYKEFYSNLVVKYSSGYIEPLKDLIRCSEILSDQQKRDLRNIDFDQIKEPLNNNTHEVCHIMQKVFKQLIKIYTPSKMVLDFFEIEESEWEKVASTQNIVKLAAVMCEDLHIRMIKSKPRILKDSANIELDRT